MLKKALLTMWLIGVATPASSQTIDELIAKNIEARGGMKNIKAIKSAKISAKLNTGQMEIPMTISWKRPNKVRTESTFQGMQIVQAFNGKTGWMIMPMLGSKEPQKLPEDELTQIKNMADDMIEGPLVDYNKKGHSIELLGKEDMEGSETFKLRVKLKNGDERVYYLDAENFIELKTTEKIKRQGIEVVQHSYMGDYQEVGGVMFPHTIDSKNAQGEGAQISLIKVELNVDIKDGIFEMPKKTS